MNLHSSCYPCWCEKEIYIQIKSLQPQESLLDKFWLLQEKDFDRGLWIVGLGGELLDCEGWDVLRVEADPYQVWE